MTPFFLSKKVDVYKMFRFHPEGLQDNDEENDLVKALPNRCRIHMVDLIRHRFVNDKAESTVWLVSLVSNEIIALAH